MTDDALARKKRRHRNERIAAAIVVLVCAAATAAIALWNAQKKRELREDQSYLPKTAVITPEVELLRELVRIDTSTPEGVARGARWIGAFLERNGIAAELIETAPGRVNVYARLRGREPGDALLLLSHIDVVPPGDGWSAPPFEARIVGDSIHGRGVIDMKATILSYLLAFVEVAKSGEPPAHDIVFLATADEETGSEHGMRWLLANRPDVFDGVRYALAEGGTTELLREAIIYYGVEIGGKQAVRLTLSGPSQQALRNFRQALEPHVTSRMPERILPEVREYFRSIAPTRIAFRPYLADIDRTIREGHFWRLPLPYRELTQNSIWCSAPILRGDEWQMEINLRNLPDEDPDARLAWLQTFMAPHDIRIERIHMKEGPVPLSPIDTELFAIVAREAERRYRVQAGPLIAYRTGSDARFLRPRGVIAYGISPFPVTYAESLTIHSTNERLRIVAFLDGIDFMKNVLARWAERD